MSSLFSSGSKYQKYARQHNYNLVESNSRWLLYHDGLLVTSEPTALDAVKFIAKKLEQMQNSAKTALSD
jgi:hypothetical protein